MMTPPQLPEPYASALIAAVAFIRAEVNVRAVVVSGTVVRGTGHASSDLDIVVIHDEPWRQRLQRWFGGVPVEMFINPPFQVRRQMDRDAQSARPVMAHMLATGHLVFDDRDGIGAALQQEARINLEAGPTVDAEWLELRRYGIATAFEDATDLLAIDPERSRALVSQAVTEAIEWWFPAHGLWLPRTKALLHDFNEHEPVWAERAREVLRSPDLAVAHSEATPLIQRLLGATGFFAWSGKPQPLAP